MRKKTIKELEARIKYLEDQNSDLNRTYNSYKDRLEHILIESNVREFSRVNVAGWNEIIDTVAQVSARAKTEGQLISVLERHVSEENARLWHIVRVVVGDESLPKPITKNLQDMGESGFSGPAKFSGN